MNKIQDITVSFTDRRFTLRLETVDNDFLQEFDVDKKRATPLYFETHELKEHTWEQQQKKIPENGGRIV